MRPTAIPYGSGARVGTAGGAMPPVLPMRAGPGNPTVVHCCCDPRVIGADGADAGEVPAELVAVTVKVYGVPVLSPVTNAVVDVPGTVALAPPGEAVTV